MGLGIVKAGATIESNWPIQNPNFEPIGKEEPKKKGNK